MDDRGSASSRPSRQAGLADYEVRSWTGWYRHVTLSLLAQAVLAAGRKLADGPPKKVGGRAGADRVDGSPEVRRLLVDELVCANRHRRHHELGMVGLATGNTRRPRGDATIKTQGAEPPD